MKKTILLLLLIPFLGMVTNLEGRNLVPVPVGNSSNVLSIEDYFGENGETVTIGDHL